jgi:hypothetical protein
MSAWAQDPGEDPGQVNQEQPRNADEANPDTKPMKPLVAAPQDSKPLPGPRYFALSYKQDWSYLEGEPGSYVEDPVHALKNIDLGNDWRMDIGGSIRMRWMSEENKLYGGRRPTQDSYLLHQYRVHANLRYKDIVRLFIEGIYAGVEDRQTGALPIDENHNDIQQAFIDIRPMGSGTPLLLRVGRQEMLYGNQRLISPLMWANTRRRFDGAVAKWQGEDWNIDGFYVRPVPVDRGEGLHHKPDEYDEDQHFFGIYSTYKGWDSHGLDLYYLVLLDHRPRPNSAGLAENSTLHTIGSRWWGRSGAWDYEAEGALQLGHHGGDRVCAWTMALESGYTFEGAPMSPRVAVGFDWSTGDRDPTDNTHGTFNQLFPLGHKYFGWMDQIGRQNIIGPHVAVNLKPCDPVNFTVAYHYLWLDSNDDALYNAGGVPGRRDGTGDSGSSVGGELDVKMTWKIDVHQSLELGYAHFWPGSFVKGTGDDDSPDFFYLQYVLNF